MKISLPEKPRFDQDRDALSPAARRGLYEAIFRRRDIRAFRPDLIPDAVVARVLVAAHHAPSVGFTQPWDFILVRDLDRRRAVKRLFEQERSKNAAQFSGRRREKFLTLKLEGILEAPLNIIVTCERERFGPGVLGKTAIADVEIYSTCLAVGKLWLAARAEGLGVGWVSILRNRELKRIFAIPRHIVPVAYLCVGYAKSFPRRPLLETAGWASRLAPRHLLHFESWRDEGAAADFAVARMVRESAIWRTTFPRVN
ncbi:MAG: 5,6-dimethylbenzimidazole synthase [Candidatus Binataceae bacterium]